METFSNTEEKGINQFMSNNLKCRLHTTVSGYGSWDLVYCLNVNEAYMWTVHLAATYNAHVVKNKLMFCKRSTSSYTA